MYKGFARSLPVRALQEIICREKGILENGSIGYRAPSQDRCQEFAGEQGLYETRISVEKWIPGIVSTAAASQGIHPTLFLPGGGDKGIRRTFRWLAQEFPARQTNNRVLQ